MKLSAPDYIVLLVEGTYHIVSYFGSVKDVVRALNIPEKDAKLIFINSVRQDLATTLQDGDRLGIFPPVGGG